MMASSLLLQLLASDPSCAADESVPLAQFAHTANEEFISRALQRQRFVPAPLSPVVVGASGSLTRADLSEGKFLTYDTDNGWNNQLLNLLCAIDMAKLLNRTLVVPPYRWQRRRGVASASVGRLIDLRTLGRLLPLIAEDEHGSIAAALEAAGVTTTLVHGEGQPHRKRRMPRWDRQTWIDTHASDPARMLRVTCCLFWTWALPDEVLRKIHEQLAYAPALVSAARAAAATLGASYGAMHVRRGDKLKVDRAYSDLFARMEPRWRGGPHLVRSQPRGSARRVPPAAVPVPSPCAIPLCHPPVPSPCAKRCDPTPADELLRCRVYPLRSAATIYSS